MSKVLTPIMSIPEIGSKIESLYVRLYKGENHFSYDVLINFYDDKFIVVNINYGDRESAEDYFLKMQEVFNSIDDLDKYLNKVHHRYYDIPLYIFKQALIKNDMY